MGSRPTSFKKGGGFLDGVDVVFTGYTFTDEFAGEPFKPGKIKGLDGKLIDKPHTVNVLCSFRPDGATEDTPITLKMANDFDAYEVSEDGLTLTAADGGECNVNQNSSGPKFFASICVGGFDENELSDDPNSINFEPMIGTRMRLIQRTDVERTKKYGMKKDKKNPGKEYERKDLVCDQVYPGEDTPAPVKSAKTNGKPPVKAATGKPAGKSKGVDIDDLSQTALVEILQANKGEIAKNKLSQRTLLTPVLKGHPNREDVRKKLADDDYLDELVEAGILSKYDKASGKIILAVE